MNNWSTVHRFLQVMFLLVFILRVIQHGFALGFLTAPIWYVLDFGAVLIEFECPFLSKMRIIKTIIKTILPLVIICHVVPLN